MAVQLNCIYRADIRVSASLVSDGHRFFARLRSNRWEKRGRGGKEGGKLANFCFSSTFSLLVSSPRSSILYPLIQFVFPFSNVAKILPFFVKYRMLFRWNNFPLFLYSFLLLVKRVDPWPHSLEFSKKKRKGDELLPISSSSNGVHDAFSRRITRWPCDFRKRRAHTVRPLRDMWSQRVSAAAAAAAGGDAAPSRKAATSAPRTFISTFLSQGDDERAEKGKIDRGWIVRLL